ncbi:hypothetical protein [Sporomusa termitida]|uniref:Uncharacterized protein n=1 Tax=Sporomusa termitida TaxID=2377 RepID=A0A517DVJ7_9FIRM|nr:hypothetical protein [Sporomusa termitida]QDR81353.1 hypothetical protein SPTER_27320 [Sporomusa termitida]
MSIVQELLKQVEAAITALITGAEEMQINGRKYRKTDLEKLRVMRKSLQEEVFYEGLSAGGTTRAYAAWPLRKGGIPPWG